MDLWFCWLVGLVEGEGSFSLSPPRITIRMTDEDVISRASTLFNARYRHTIDPRGYKDVYSIQVGGRSALSWMSDLYPHLGVRRRARIASILEARRIPLPKLGLGFWNDAAIYWLAGLLEGEGTFCPGIPSAPNLPFIQIEMTDCDVIKRAADQLSSSVYNGKEAVDNRKASFETRVRGTKAIEWMRVLRPFMGTRRQEQIDRALASYDPQFGNQRGAFNSQTKLSEAQVLEIYRRAWKGEGLRALGREFGIAHTIVLAIKNGTKWAWLTKHNQ